MSGRPLRGRVVEWTCRHRLVGFLLVTFGLSWGVPLVLFGVADVLDRSVSVSGYSPLAFLVVWAPTLAASVVVGVTSGWAGLRGYARRVVQPRGRLRWYAAVGVGVPAVYLASALLASATGGPAVAVPSGWAEPFVVVALLRLTQGPVEELGWRGFALPLLQRRFSGLVSAVLLGVVWALWHTPALVVATAEFALGGAFLPGVARLFVSMVATSVVVTVVFNGSNGSVPLAVCFHWLTNLAYPWERSAAVPLAQDVAVVVVAVVVAATVGRRYLGETGLATDLFVGVDDAGDASSDTAVG